MISEMISGYSFGTLQSFLAHIAHREKKEKFH